MIDLFELERRIKAVKNCTPQQALEIIQGMKIELYFDNLMVQ